MRTSELTDILPKHRAYTHELLKGLSKRKKTISPKFLYDKKGSEIFEQICQLKEYYPIHAETEILQRYAKQIATALGKEILLIEPGCGNCTKVRYLLRALDQPQAYVAMDISKEFIEKTAKDLQSEFPEIPVFPVAGDYTQKLVLPSPLRKLNGRRVIFFPGSTIGNMDTKDSIALLKNMSKLVEPDGGVLIGVDLKKDAKVLELAYDDPKGVTAEFNYNLLDRLNREFSGSFERRNFQYEASYNKAKGRVEMFLISQRPQSVHLAGKTIRLSKNEAIRTEDSYKYSVPEFKAMAKAAGFTVKKTWQDRRRLFCVYFLERVKS